MKDSGLGTPATRAAIIEVLLKREYIVRSGKNLEATDKGIRLIEVVHPEVKSPAMTGQWEAYLKRIERGEAQLGPFIEGIEEYVREVVGKVAQTARRSRESQRHAGAATPRAGRVAAIEDEPLARSAAPRVRIFLVSRESGRGLPHGDRRPRRAAGDADGRGQIALLPAAGHRARRHHAGDQSADCADGRSVREAARARIRGGVHSLGARSRGFAPGLHRLSRGQAAVPVHRAGATARQRLSGDAGEAEAGSGRHRRSALHFAMGPRFPARLPAARAVICPRCGPRR